MAKIVLGKNPAQVETDSAEELKRIAEEAEKRQLERDAKLRKLIAKKKTTKTLIIAGTVSVLTLFTIFGVYNTFIKHTLNENDVANIANSTIVTFPTSGLEGYLVDNFDNWFAKTVTYSTDTKTGFEYVKSDLDSLSIDYTQTVSDSLVRVYFSVNIMSKKYDTNITDATGQTITTKNEPVTERVHFYIPIQLITNTTSNGNIASTGYAPAGALSYNMYVETDSAEVVSSPYLEFTSEEYDESTVAAAKTAVSTAFTQMYSDKDYSLVYTAPRGFQNYLNATFNNITDFHYYKEPNALGYNCYVTYNVTAKSGYTVTVSAYLSIEKSGKSWIINGML